MFLIDFSDKTVHQNLQIEENDACSDSSNDTIIYDSKQYEKNLVCDTGKEDEINNHESNCFKIDMKTVENMFDVNLTGTKYFEKQIPKCGRFSLCSTKWKTALSSVKGRQIQKGRWHHIMNEGIKQYNPYCVFMIRRHQINVSKHRRKRKGSKLFSAHLYCKFKDCPVQCKLQMYSTDKVDIQFDGNIRHDLREQRSRPISGDERKEVMKEFETGQKPYRLYLKKFRDIPDDVKIAGNVSSVGTSTQVLRKIASQSRRVGAMDADEWKSLLKMSTEMSFTSLNKKVKGFIQHISLVPSYVMYWNESGIRLWHQLANNSTVFWDATGSIIKTRSDESKYLYYELALANPTPKEPTIPVASMISTSHDTPQIHYWLSKFRLEEKKLFGHGNVAIPRQVNSDRSLVFLQSALLEFCGETINTFRSRAWRILNGTASTADLRKTVPHGCLSHTMKNFKELCKSHYKSNLQYGMFMLSILVNVEDLPTATKTLRSILLVLLSKYITPRVKEAAAYIDTRIQSLPKVVKTIIEEEDSELDKLLTSTDPNPNMYSEEEYILRSKGNEFSSWAEKVKDSVLKTINEESQIEMQANYRSSTELSQHLMKRYISFFPIWSNMLLGDLSRHHRRDMEHSSIEENYSNQQKTNAIIEQRFRVLKDVYFSGRRFSRLDIFSKELDEHIDSIQKLAVLRHMKSRPKHLKKATQTVKESWMKKISGTPENIKSGKYQKKPSIPVNTFPERKYKTTNTKPKAAKKQVKRTEIVKPDDIQSISSESSVKPDKALPKSSQYEQTTMVQDMAINLFSNENILANLETDLSKLPYLNEIYFDMASKSLSMNYLQYFKDSHTGLANVGTSCWFNAVVQLLADCKFMQNVNEHFVNNLTFEDGLRNVLEVFHRVAVGKEVHRQHLQSALNDLQNKYKIDTRHQNDAHEFVSTAISDFMEVTEISILSR